MFVEDTSLFFADFGVPVTLMGRQVQAIFDNGYALGNVGTVGMASAQPALVLATADVPPAIIDWLRYYAEPFDPVDLQITLTVAGVPTGYTIVAHEPDGTGMSRLLLELTA